MLFCDVTGSTSLGERLDPETMRHVMGRYFERTKAVIEWHGGTVEKFIGDAVMAVFGIPTLHEDDALRACQAACGVRDALAELNEELERDRGVAIRVRTGVMTGEVVAGDPSAGERLVTGDAVNTAARLEQAASPGEILIGEPTLRLVRDLATVEEAGALNLKGKEAPVPAFRLLDVARGAEAAGRRLDSPMVGRDRERRLLLEGFDRSVSQRSCHLFTVIGPAGVGKSRLIQDFFQVLEGKALVLRGRCLSYGEGITFRPVIEMVEAAAGIQDVDSADQARERIDAVLHDVPSGDQIGARLAQVLGLEASSAALDEVFWAIRKFLEALAEGQPLVAVFDDVHWAEPALLDLIEHVADWARDAPILLVCLARHELLDQRPAWAGGKLNATSLLLDPLGEQESATLIENLLGGAHLSEEVHRKIVEAAEGNPLFVEEMLAMLIDDGLLRRDDGRWVPSQDLSAIAAPASIHALISARLDRLVPAEREVIERGAVEGKVFHRGAVSELCPEDLRSAVPGHLMALARKDLIRPDRPEFAGEDAFRFRHLLIRDAAYDALPKETRAELHERFAGWLQTVAGDRLAEYEEIVGYHLEQAHRYREELGVADRGHLELARRAAKLLGTAGWRALDRGDAAAAGALLERAVGLLRPGDPDRVPVLFHLGITLGELGLADLERADEVLSAAVDEARAAGDASIEGRALLARAEIAMLAEPEGKTEAARREAERLIPLFEGLGDDLGLSAAWGTVASVHWVANRFEQSGAASELAADHAARAGDRWAEVDSLGRLASAAVFGPTPVPEAIRLCERISARGGRSPRVELVTLKALVELKAMHGDFAEARTLGRVATELALDLGGLLEVFVLESLRDVEMLAEDLDAAERYGRRGCELLAARGDLGHLSTYAGYLARILYAQGKLDEAYEQTEVSRTTAASDDIVSQSLWRSVRAMVLARRGDLDPAVALAEEAVDVMRGTDALDAIALGFLDQHETLRLAGPHAEARDAARRALEKFEQKGNLVGAGKARCLLALSESTPP